MSSTPDQPEADKGGATVTTAPGAASDGEKATAANAPPPKPQLPVLKRPWYRSLWLVPVLALLAIVVVDLAAGATVVVGVAAVGAAMALAAAVIALRPFRHPIRTVAAVVALSAAATAVLVLLQRPSVRDALEPDDKPSSTVAAKRSPIHPPRTLRGVVVRPDQVRARDLQKVDLTSATLDGLDLRGRNFDGADLRGASLAGADLRGAQLVDAHLEGAILRGARLSGACLVLAHLDGADVTGATFGGADVTHLRGAQAARRTARTWPRRRASSTVCH